MLYETLATCYHVTSIEECHNYDNCHESVCFYKKVISTYKSNLLSLCTGTQSQMNHFIQQSGTSAAR